MKTVSLKRAYNVTTAAAMSSNRLSAMTNTLEPASPRGGRPEPLWCARQADGAQLPSPADVPGTGRLPDPGWEGGPGPGVARAAAPVGAPKSSAAAARCARGRRTHAEHNTGGERTAPGCL